MPILVAYDVKARPREDKRAPTSKVKHGPILLSIIEAGIPEKEKYKK